jgi:hypothetical protein
VAMARILSARATPAAAGKLAADAVELTARLRAAGVAAGVVRHPAAAGGVGEAHDPVEDAHDKHAKALARACECE